MVASCPNPSGDLGLVQGLLTSVDCNVRGIVELGYGALSRPGSQVSFALTAMLTLYIAFFGLRLMWGQSQLRVGDLTVTIVKIGVVLALATSWPTYQQLVFDTLFRGPSEIAGSMLSAIDSPQSIFHGNPFDSLQVAYDEMQVDAGYYTSRSNAMASPLVGGNPFAAFALNMSAFIMLMTTLGVILTAKIVLGLLLGLGPVFVAMLLFDATRGLFEGWLRAALAFAFAPLFVVMALVIQLMLLEPHLIRLAELRAVNQVDIAPAVAIFTLTLISAAVSGAGLIAVGMIAKGLRLRAKPAPTRAETPSTAQALVNRANDAVPAARLVVENQPRAASVAAAAAAMDRRDIRLLADGGAAPSRLGGFGGAQTSTVVMAATPLGQSYRRTAQPRRAVSSARRDR